MRHHPSWLSSSLAAPILHYFYHDHTNNSNSNPSIVIIALCPSLPSIIHDYCHWRHPSSTNNIIIHHHGPSSISHRPSASIIHQRSFFCHHESAIHQPWSTLARHRQLLVSFNMFIHPFLPQQGANFLLDAKFFTLPKSESEAPRILRCILTDQQTIIEAVAEDTAIHDSPCWSTGKTCPKWSGAQKE